jgi:hypothetical protein
MIEAMRRLLALLLATLVLALPAQAADPTPRVKNTKGEIESMAMDGPRLAYAVKSDTCTKVIVLNVLTRSAALARGPKTCDADNSSTGAGVRKQVPELMRVVPPTARPSGRTTRPRCTGTPM